jgi:hypothetical protein
MPKQVTRDRAYDGTGGSTGHHVALGDLFRVLAPLLSSLGTAVLLLRLENRKGLARWRHDRHVGANG